MLTRCNSRPEISFSGKATSVAATFSSSWGGSSMWIWPRKLARRISAGIQSGIAPMANMESIAANCSLLRRLNVLHQVGELFRGHIVKCIRLVLLNIRVLLRRLKLIERHPRPGVAGEQRISVRVFPAGDGDKERFGRQKIFVFIWFGVFV